MTDQQSRDLSIGGPADRELPNLPPRIELDLGERGTLKVRDLPGPDGAPTVVLLHGWTATADLNYFTCYEPLMEHYRVVAFDLRGHAHGLRSKKAFRLLDAADDAIAIADALGVDRFIPVGYSMGGTIAQLIARDHSERLDGLVLCATAPYFAGRREERLSFVGLTGLAALARITPNQARNWITGQFYLQRKEETWGEYAMQQVALHDWRAILEAGKAIGDFTSSDWIGDVHVPTSLIVTLNDPVVPLRRQLKLWDWIPDCDIFRVEGAHDAAVVNADRFVPQLLRALHSVRERGLVPS